jgi:hypothetical protein
MAADSVAADSMVAADVADSDGNEFSQKGLTMPATSIRVLKASSWVSVLVMCAGCIFFASQTALAQQKMPAKNSSPVTQQPEGKAFRTPAAAAASLYAAARRNDENEILVILGPGAKQLVVWTSDPNDRAEERKIFADNYDQMHRLVKEPDDTVALYVGAENWPLPIPIVEYKGKWYFDTSVGRQEVLYRQIGRNEMQALEVCHALIDAEKDYYAGAHTYTAKFISDGDSHDGLYWKPSAKGAKSPIGPYLAHAGGGVNAGNSQPYYGYYYRVVLKPDSAGNGGEYAVLAFPAEYRSSGVKTFFVAQDGTAYEKDLGPKTDDAAKQMTDSSPDSTWSKVE